jgi:4,5-dihydroxyphthalate decarboxylase
MPTAFTRPITSGEVVVDSLELEIFEPTTTDQNSRDMIEFRFDVAEMSIATLTKAIEIGLPLVALPVFTSGRRFVQSGMFLAKSSDVTSFDDLPGRAVGLPQYWISSCVWQRHVLERVHGIAPQQVRWVTEQPERFAGVGVPEDVDCQSAPNGDLAALMRSGDIDACLMPGGRPLPPALAEVTVPAYPDCVRAERDYYLAQGAFPLMHVTAIRRELAENEPWVVPALLDAYVRAKELAVSRPDVEWPLPPLGHDYRELRDLLGGDPWPYGVSANRAALETFLRCAREQGLVTRAVEPEQLFVRDLPPEFG